jgi:phospholipid transport system substrate-binding protein
MNHHFPAMGRRNLLGVAIAASGFAVAWHPVRAEAANDAGAIAPVQRLNAALIAAMQAGPRMSFAQRFATLTPVVEQTFDLDAVLAASIGLTWATVPDNQKAGLRAAFVRYTVASYAANFNHFNGQSFQVSPSVRDVGYGEVVVSNKLIAADGSATPLDYVMRYEPSGWKAVDVLANGSISRVAVQRSDFRELLTTGGVPALMAALQRKVANLSGGMLA